MLNERLCKSGHVVEASQTVCSRCNGAVEETEVPVAEPAEEMKPENDEVDDCQKIEEEAAAKEAADAQTTSTDQEFNPETVA